MANKTYYAYANGGSRLSYRGKVTLNEHQDIESNTFIIDYYFWIYRADGYTGAAHSFANGNRLVVVINDNTIISSPNYKKVVLTGTNEANAFLMCSGQVTVPANADGTKSFDFNFTYDQTQSVGQELDYITVAGTHTCTQIPRASKPTLSAAEVEFGDTITIYTNRVSESFVHTLKYSMGSASGTIASNVADSQSFTIPSSLMYQIPNANSGTVTITCETYQNGTLIGTENAYLTANVPDNVVPEISVEITEAADIPEGITIGYIQLKSKLRVFITASGAHGSKIRSYSSTVDGVGYSGAEFTTQALVNSGNIAIECYVTDTRGRTAFYGESIYVNAYYPPKVTSVSAFRCASMSDPTESPSSGYICVKPRGSITPLSNQNARTGGIYYKKSSENTYNTVFVPFEGYEWDTEYIVFEADTGSSYDLKVVIGDSFVLSEFDAPSVLSASVPVDLMMDNDEKSVVAIGIGKTAEEEKTVDIAWKLYLRNGGKVYSGNDFYELSDLVNDLSDSGWISIPLEEGIYEVDWIKCAVRRIGQMVNVRFGATGATEAYQYLGTLPEGFRPETEVNVCARYGNGPYVAVTISTDGRIRAMDNTYGYSSTEAVSFNTTFFVKEELP